MASRSTVSTPVAGASAATWFASGESTLPVGIDLGSETMFMPHFYAQRPAGSTGQRCRSDPIGQIAVMREIAEPRKLAFKLQFDCSGGAVALLADDDFGLAMHQRHVEL